MAEYIDITSLMNHIETQTRKWVLIKNAFDKILRENDTMREQLSSIGKRLGDNMDDVQPVVRGRWESNGDGFGWVFICSVCGFIDGHPFNDRMNYCPICGADMRGEDDV